MKNKSVIALMLAFTVSFTSVCPALAAENTAVESEEVTESEPEEVSEENAVPAEETAPEEQNVSGADEAVMDASSGNQTEPVETTEVTGDTEEITDETANATEETENVTDEAADAADENEDDADAAADAADGTTDVAVAEGTTEEYSNKAGEAAAEPEFTGTITITVEGQSDVPESSGDESPEDLFEQYMGVEFGLSGRSSMRKAKKTTGTRLEGNDLAVYQVVARELPAIVDRRVGRIDELAGNKAVRDLQRQLGGLGDRALHALGALCEDQLRSVCFQNIASLHAHGLGHRQNNAVALRGCDRRKTDTGIAGCGFNDRGAFSQQTLGFRVFDHRLGDAVLYASRGIEVLKFHKDFRFQSKVSLNICDL